MLELIPTFNFKSYFMEERHMNHKWYFNCIGGVMVSVFFPSVVDSGIEPSLIKDYVIYICCFNAKLPALR